MKDTAQTLGIIVRGFITKGSKMSRVTLNTPVYQKLVQSGKALASRGKDEPMLKPTAEGLRMGQQWMTEFTIDGYKVYYGWNKNPVAGDTTPRDIIVMATADAEKLHTPMGVELEFGDILENNTRKTRELVLE
jgi:hypothetical protein